MTARIEKTVFISYRRTNVIWARAIYQDLTIHGYDAFFDFQSINSGDFSQIILENIKARAHFILLLTPSALERCDNPDDWLRKEIETAIEFKRNIVPLMLENFEYSSPSSSKYLIGKLSLLKNYNGLRIHSDYFEEGMARLRDRYLNTSLDAVLHPVSSIVYQETQRQKEIANKAPEVSRKEFDAQQWFEQGYKHTKDKNFDEAIRCFSKAINLNTDYTDFYTMYRGLVYHLKKDFENAITDFTEVIRIKPDHAEAFCARGNVFYRIGNRDNAIADYTDAIRLNPEYAEAFCERGNAFYKIGNHDNAIADYTDAIRLNPDYAEAYEGRADARDDIGDIDGAIKDYSEAIRLNPNNSRLYSNRARARGRNGDLDGAIEDLNVVLQLRPESADVYNKRARVRMMQGDLEGAITDSTEAIRLKPDDGDSYSRLGVLYFLNNNSEQSIASFNNAIRLKPDYAELYSLRGASRKEINDLEGAIADYQKYLELGGGIRNGDQKDVEEKVQKLNSQLTE